MKTLTKNLLIWSAGALILVSPTQLPASTLLIDRGLPTINLNIPGQDGNYFNRCNVSWAARRKDKPSDTNYELVGDTITNTSSTDYHIDTIRLWTTGPVDSAILWGGPHGGTIELLDASPSMTRVYYIDGQTYGFLGSAIHQLDFSVSIILKVGETYDFLLDGSRPTWPFIPYLHASNAALSGSPQEGADNLMLLADYKRGEVKKVVFWDAIKQSWDKSTDVNVQVFGEVLEAGSTVAAFASAGGFLPAPTPNTAGETVEPLQPALDEFVPFASVQLGLTTPLVLRLMAMPSYPVYPSSLDGLTAVEFSILADF